MDAATKSAEVLRRQINAVEGELKVLREKLSLLECRDVARPDSVTSSSQVENDNVKKWPLSLEEYQRYGRQMIVPNIGIQGQLLLKAASVLIVGAGGLGCPAAAYLAGSGVGTIGLVDGDVVEMSNLHRQILHSTSKVGMKKVDSAIAFLKSLNPNVIYIPHREHLSPQNSESIVSNYDLVLDCTDHPTSRYLISDICILLSKPLISASALRTDGQLIVLNSPPRPPGDASGGPCYRCVFPKPPPAESVVSCGDGGILGPAVGVMGVLQALEAVKLIVSGKLTSEKTSGDGKSNETSMLLFSSNSLSPFRSVRLRARRAKCFACSAESGLTLESLTSGSMDYVQFCGVLNPVDLLDPKERIEAKDYERLMDRKDGEHLLIDIREKVQFDICSIEGSVNVPFSTFQSGRGPKPDEERPQWIPQSLPPDAPIYVVCRLGNDSQVVTKKLKESGWDRNGERFIGDIKGGLRSWKQQVDKSWPEY